MYNPPNYPNHSSQKIIQPESVLANRQDLVMPLVHPKWPEFNPEKAKTKTIQYILDSRDRNISAYPDANKYILQLFTRPPLARQSGRRQQEKIQYCAL